MHRFQTQSTIIRLRFAALFFWLVWLLIPTSVVTLVYSFVKHDETLTYIALGLWGLTVVVFVLQWILASRPRCPLCMTPILAHKSCSKHRSSKRLFGSYRLRVATTVLLKGSFHCSYCNEPTVLKVRERHGNARANTMSRGR